MQQWNVEHRVFGIEQFFFRNNDSVVTVRLFRRQFNVARDGAIPDRNTILQWVESFRTTGSVMKRTSSGRPRTTRTPENVESVRRSVIESPWRFTRRRASILGLSRRLLQRILHDELNSHPYKIVIVQKLLPNDFVQHRLFCEIMLEIIASDDVMLMMSDEVHFHLDGYVSKQNCQFWAAENPQKLHQRPLHNAKVSVWCGISKVGIVGPYFFEEEGATVTVTSERCVEMLRNFLRPQLQSLWVNMEEMWFQQDGATAHTARSSMTVV